MSSNKLVISGARQHNLKDIDLVLPRDKMIVFTGLSGSGKSSLAFDTIYAEGQRRYVESLSSYARQFLGQMDKPEVDFIEGLSPAISIDQKSTSRNPRSTVGTITEVYDYMRLLYARVGKPHCPSCGQPVHRQAPEQIVDRILEMPEGSRFEVLAPVVRGRKGEYEALLEGFAKQGFARAKVDGELLDLAETHRLDRYHAHTIAVVVDRLVLRDGIRRRLTDSVETALELAEGIVEITIVPRTPALQDSRHAENPNANTATATTTAEDSDLPETLVFSRHLACADCGLSFEELAPRNFSFNSPYGACPTCDGLGTRHEVDEELVVPDPSLSLSENALAPWSGHMGKWWRGMLEALAKEVGFSFTDPWEKLSARHRKTVLHGLPKKTLEVSYTNRYGRKRVFRRPYEGVVPWLHRRHEEVDSDGARDQVEGYMRLVDCSVCGGDRLSPVSLAVTIAGKNIAQVCRFAVGETRSFMAELVLNDRDAAIASEIRKEIDARLGFLVDVGLGYLTLHRASGTLSGGEAQRIRLATQIGSGLVGVLYILDEPSIGLHQRDNRRLIKTLERLCAIGNTLIVVEHDEDTIRAADHLVDIGPGAGEEGGEIVVAGTLDDLLTSERSVTGAYLSGRRKIPVTGKRRPGNGNYLLVRGARENNLANIDVTFPLGTFIAVTGVSGSGKSSLVNDILAVALAHRLHRAKAVPGKHRSLEGVEHLDKIVVVDQSPIGRTPRSNPATYTGVFDHIRKLFAQTPEAKVRGYLPGRFSFNKKGGRCEACTGDGTIKIEMFFLPDVYVPCEVCGGARYNRDTLEVLWKGHNIAQVLAMPVADACNLFASVPKISRHLQTLVDVGLGYVRLGQPAPTLSGGEAQRVKLASELSRRSTGRTLYVLDEPTTGLHFDDVAKLLFVLDRLVENGNTVLVIEHNLDVVKSADWIIDLGPEGGDEGGRIVAEGTPEEVVQHEISYTGAFLRKLLA